MGSVKFIYNRKRRKKNFRIQSEMWSELSQGLLMYSSESWSVYWLSVAASLMELKHFRIELPTTGRARLLVFTLQCDVWRSLSFSSFNLNLVAVPLLRWFGDVTIWHWFFNGTWRGWLAGSAKRGLFYWAIEWRIWISINRLFFYRHWLETFWATWHRW